MVGVRLEGDVLMVGSFPPDARCADVLPLIATGAPIAAQSVHLRVGADVREYEYVWMTPSMAQPANVTVKCDGQGAIVSIVIETHERGGGDSSYFSSLRALAQLGRTPYNLRQIRVDPSLRWSDLLEVWIELERHYRIGHWPNLALRES